MQATQSKTQKRIDSIDVLRGITMIVMALDHVRDFFHVSANTGNPLDLTQTTPQLFFTRWITHFCAPLFVFLSGTSIYLQGLRKSKTELAAFLIKRGLWLILVEVLIMSFAFTFDSSYSFIIFQVIWSIGISMLILAILIRFAPFGLILTLGLLIVFGHNLLDIPESAQGFKAGFWWDLLHHGFFSFYPLFGNHTLIILYAFGPWTGVMMLGYCTGVLFAPGFSQEKRKKILLRLGAGALLLFVVLRFINVYGDPFPWSVQKNALFTFLSFINVFKYPPSLLYLCLTLGTGLLALSFLDQVQNGITRIARTYGRVPFFYYILHFYLIHILAVIVFFLKGHSYSEAVAGLKNVIFMFVLQGEGFDLPGVYLIWAGVVIALYPLCKKYDQYKSAHREKWWLGYL